jgi:hypothetical protein
VRTAAEITSDVIEQPVADSFRTRDTLCPAAAHLAAGMPIEQLGGEVDHATPPREDLRRLRGRRVRRDLRPERVAHDRARDAASALEGVGLALGDPVWISRPGPGAAGLTP